MYILFHYRERIGDWLNRIEIMQKFELISKSQLKKIRNLAEEDAKKAANKLAKEVTNVLIGSRSLKFSIVYKCLIE